MGKKATAQEIVRSVRQGAMLKDILADIAHPSLLL
jgi:hypothetical protein